MIPKEWMIRAIDMEVGKELWVPCQGKKDQTRILNLLERDKLALAGYFPVQAAQVTVTRERKGRDYYVKLAKEPSGNPLYIWEKELLKDEEGRPVVSQDMIRILIDPIQIRRLLQMEEDKISLEQMSSLEHLPVEHIRVLLEYAKTGKYPKPTIGRPRKVF